MKTSGAPEAVWLFVRSRTKQAKSDLFSNTFYTTWMLTSAKQINTMNLLKWEPLLIQTVPGVTLDKRVYWAKYLLHIVEDKDTTLMVVGLL